MAGSLRSWIHYIDLRTEAGTQLEHRQIAQQAKEIFVKEFPTIGKALDWI
jgi:thymidylate synthase (FAD)